MDKIMNALVESIAQKVVTQLSARSAAESPESPKRYAYSLGELAEYLGCSKSTVWRYKSTGALKGCYKQLGKTIVFDLDSIDSKLAC